MCCEICINFIHIFYLLHNVERRKKGSQLDFADKLQTRDKITISVRQMSLEWLK